MVRVIPTRELAVFFFLACCLKNGALCISQARFAFLNSIKAVKAIYNGYRSLSVIFRSIIIIFFNIVIYYPINSANNIFKLGLSFTSIFFCIFIFLSFSIKAQDNSRDNKSLKQSLLFKQTLSSSYPFFCNI